MPTKRIRFVASQSGVERALCSIVFGSDASIYLIPHGTTGRYWFGDNKLEFGNASLSFDFTKQCVSPDVPKISIHPSGQVHVKSTGNALISSKVLHIPALRQFRGEHIASLAVDKIAGLPICTQKFVDKRHERVLRVEFDSQILSTRLCFYANASEPLFAHSGCIAIQVGAQGKRGLYFGTVAKSQELLGESERRGGSTVICGWNPMKESTAEQDFFYLRTE